MPALDWTPYAKIFYSNEVIFLKLKRTTLAVLVFGSLPASALHIMLDPGHGGVDKGAVYGSAKEAELVLKVAQKLKHLLELNPQFRVSLTRDLNKYLSLSTRVNMAEETKADIFVSLHANAAEDSRAKGVEFFFQNHLPADEEALYLASQENKKTAPKENGNYGNEELSKKSDITAIVDDLQRQNRIQSSLRLSEVLNHVWSLEPRSTQATIKQAPFYVISKTSMPSVLIEIGFLSNPVEVKKLLTADYQNDLAQKIYSALLSYKEKMDNSTAKTLN